MTTRPANPTSSSYRVNIVMTGFEEYVTIDGISDTKG
jgi:hypothetical protein